MRPRVTRALIQASFPAELFPQQPQLLALFTAGGCRLPGSLCPILLSSGFALVGDQCSSHEGAPMFEGIGTMELGKASLRSSWAYASMNP